MTDSARVKSKRGFASMTPEKREAIASLGGKAAHAKGVAHVWTTGEEARAAGRRGGEASVKARRAKREIP